MLELYEILLILFNTINCGDHSKVVARRRSEFLIEFARAWSGELGRKNDCTVFGENTVDYNSAMLLGKKSIPLRSFQDLHDLHYKANSNDFLDWIKECLPTAQQWEQLRCSLAEKGAPEIVAPKQLHDLLVDVIQKKYEAAVVDASSTCDLDTTSTLDALGITCESKAAVEYVITDGIHTIKFNDLFAALNTYCKMTRQNPTLLSLQISLVNSFSTFLLIYRRSDEQNTLVLPNPISAESMLCPEIYIAIATINYTLCPIIKELNYPANRLFMEKVAHIRFDRDGNAIPNPEYTHLFNDEATTLSFSVQPHLLARRIGYESFEAAYDAWAKCSWGARLYLDFENDTVPYRCSIPIYACRHTHFERLYWNPIVMCSAKVGSFLEQHSTKKRTFWGIE